MNEEELQDILDKVKDLFMRYGIKSVTMDDVSRELGISKKTLYQYVTNKEELVVKVLQYLHNQYKKEDCDMEGLNAIDALMKVHDMVNKMMQDHNPSMQYDLKKYYPDIYRKFYKGQSDDIYEKIVDNIKKGIREGLYRSEIDPNLVAKLYISRVGSMMDSEVFTVDEIKTPGFFLVVMELHIRSLATPKGLLILEEKLKTYNN